MTSRDRDEVRDPTAREQPPETTRRHGRRIAQDAPRHERPLAARRRVDVRETEAPQLQDKADRALRRTLLIDVHDPDPPADALGGARTSSSIVTVWREAAHDAQAVTKRDSLWHAQPYV